MHYYSRILYKKLETQELNDFFVVTQLVSLGRHYIDSVKQGMEHTSVLNKYLSNLLINIIARAIFKLLPL